mmetsp:Transcript_92378/g.183416  ORF Transcript_92378/g.183416 Transcript_92378/m.183416 type:complete len:310 (-) Transcript_92378:313-1242(-)
MDIDSLGPTLVAATAWGAAAGGATQQTAASMITAVIRALAEVEGEDLVKHGNYAMMAHGAPKAGCSDLDIDAKGVSRVGASDRDANGVLNMSEQEKPTEQLQQQQKQDRPTGKSFDHERVATKNNHLMYEIHADGVSPDPLGQPQSVATSDMDANGFLNVSAHDQLTGKSFEHLSRYLECICADKTVVPMGTDDMDAKGILNMPMQEEPTCRPEVTSDCDANGILNLSPQEKATDASLLLPDATPVSKGVNAAGGVTTNSSERRRVEEIRATLAGLKALVSQYIAPRQAARMRKLEQQLETLEAGSEAP